MTFHWTSLLVLENLSLSYGPIRALENVSFDVVQSSTTALVGPNGAGKTSLLRIIAGLVSPDSGRVFFRGQDITGLPSHRIAALGIAHVAEGRHLFPNLSVRENLELAAVSPQAQAQRHPRLERILALFPRLTERLDDDAGMLSAGEQQMTAIGRALMAAPDLILFDEPTRGLTPKLTRQLFQLIGTLKTEGITILLAEQHTTAALRLADSAHILNQGSIALSGFGLDLLEAYQNADDTMS